MKKIILFVALSLILSVLIYSFKIKKSQTGEISVKTIISGEELFLKNCASCHGKNKEGNLPAFPALKNIGNRLNKQEMYTLLKTGRNAMPSFSYLSKDEREAIIAYLLGEEVSVAVATEFNPIEAGKHLFIANCAACHKVKLEDPVPTGLRNYGMSPAILGGINKRFSIEHFERILNMGPCYMPSFTNLSTADKTYIYEYLSNFEYAKVRSDYRNCGCRMKY